MSISAAPKISDQTVSPISKAGNAAVKFTPEFLPPSEAYPGAEDRQVDNDEKNKKQASGLTSPQKDDTSAEKTNKPEIFKLLERYHFEDFFQLSLSKDDYKLAAVIKKSRKSRGVSLSLPLSYQYTAYNVFINQVTEQYLHTNWLMKDKPGALYTGVL